MLECAWKPNWEETKRHFVDWWNHDGLVIQMWNAPQADRPRLDLPAPESPADFAETYTNIEWRLREIHPDLSRRAFPADTLPLADTNLGSVSFAPFLGCEPHFTPETVWYVPSIQDIEEPASLPPLRFDPENRWWKLFESLLRQCREQAGNDYLLGCPSSGANLDILATLREPQTLLVDMIERPEWVLEKMDEIHQFWCEVFSRIYEITKLADGSSASQAFYVWGPGKTGALFCDTSAMFSPAMFGKFVAPVLTKQCEWLDHSLYHLDGTQALCHLDHLLGIDALDAIQWTPQAGIEKGDNPRWWDLYRRVLAAGKAVMAFNEPDPEKVVPLLDAIGGKGVNLMIHFDSERQAEKLLVRVEQFR
jgi:hypothetical protein